MKKYKTSEAIAMLEKNPGLRFKKDSGGYTHKLFVDHGYFRFMVYSEVDELVPQYLGGGAFNGNLHTKSGWELIQQPVDFLTAVKAYSEGKTIRCEIGNNEPSFYSREVAISVLTGKKIYGSTCLIDNHGGTITTEEILEGTWYVEDSYENH